MTTEGIDAALADKRKPRGASTLANPSVRRAVQKRAMLSRMVLAKRMALEAPPLD
jgi:hypothetical protein